MSVVYDAGVLVAAERNQSEIWADHRARLEFGVVPTTTAPVVAQVSRSPRQVQLRRFLRGCNVEPFAGEQAHDVGSLLGQAGSTDVVDAHVVLIAAASSATIWISDPLDIGRLADHVSAPVAIRSV